MGINFEKEKDKKPSVPDPGPSSRPGVCNNVGCFVLMSGKGLSSTLETPSNALYCYLVRLGLLS